MLDCPGLLAAPVCRPRDEMGCEHHVCHQLCDWLCHCALRLQCRALYILQRCVSGTTCWRTGSVEGCVCLRGLDLCMCMCACLLSAAQEQFVRIMLFTGIAVALETCMFAAVSLYASKRGIQKGITSLLVPLAQLTRHHVCYSLFMWAFAAHGNRTCTQRLHSRKRSLTSSPCFPSQSRLMRSQQDSSLDTASHGRIWGKVCC